MSDEEFKSDNLSDLCDDLTKENGSHSKTESEADNNEPAFLAQMAAANQVKVNVNIK